ncbi:MAG: CHAT domain-containing protein [Bryobacterales bacterium]|nr:CHAT domain-containing protein [Bryobacterales bacterium]
MRPRAGPAFATSTYSPSHTGRTEARSLYAASRFLEAESAYQKCYWLAAAAGDPEEAFRCLNGIAGARFAMYQYRGALRAYLQARRLAESLGRPDFLAAVHTNLSSLYLQQQDINAAAGAAEDALRVLRRAGSAGAGALPLTQAAIIQARQGNLPASTRLFREALDEAYLRADPATLGLIWDQLGYELLLNGNLDEAETALVEAFRIRKLSGLKDLQYSYYTLGMLHLARNRPEEAARMLDAALSLLSKPPVTLALWRVHYERGRAALQAGFPAEALEHFRRAVGHARQVRMELLPADSVWINTGVDQHQLYSALIRTAGALYESTKDPAYVRLGFEAAEELRAGGLRALAASPDEWRRRLPDEYWETLARLRGMESRLLNGGNSGAGDEAKRLHYRLTELEAAAGIDIFPSAHPGETDSPGLLRRVQSALRDGDAYFSLHQDEPESYLFVVTPRSLHLFRAAGRRRLASLSERFRTAVRADLPEHVQLGRELHNALFGAIPNRLAAAPRWLLSLDGDLYKAPLAALVSGSGRDGIEYLAERHVLRLAPSAGLLSPGTRQTRDGPFVAIGDPIYNQADERLPPDRRTGNTPAALMSILPRLVSRTGPPAGMELPRLAGSASEIRACARAWHGGSGTAILLTGAQASLDAVDRALAPGAAVVHFATHFVPSAVEPGRAMIALSLNEKGAPEFLGPAEITRRRLDVGLVVLSGCASATGEAVPAEGLLGMTRAWLAAGAGSVLGTLWPTADDDGSLLTSFYRHMAALRDRRDGWAAAEALRRGQLEALRGGSRQSRSPAHWGAYVLAGGE